MTLLGGDPQAPPAFEGRISNPDPQALTVTIDGFDDDLQQRHEWGPCVLMPRGHHTPARGDRCLVIMSDTGSPWVVAWPGPVPSPPPPLVTRLPARPTDGDEIHYLAGPNSGFVWRLRYRAGSPSAYKWEFTGGSPLSVLTAANEFQLVAVGWGELTTPNRIVAPLDGEYSVRATAKAYTGDTQVAMGFGVNSSSSVVWWTDGVVSAALGTCQAIEMPIVALAAGASVRQLHYAANTSVQWARRSLTLQPIRVR